MGIGPVLQPWEGRVLPLYDTRNFLPYLSVNLLFITSYGIMLLYSIIAVNFS